MKQALQDTWRTMRGAIQLPGTRAMGTLGTTGLSLGLGMVTSVLLARWLGPSGRGEIAAALLWPSMLIYLGSFGLIASVLYHGAQADIDPGEIYGTALVLTVLQSAIAVAVGYVALPALLKSQDAEVIAAARLYLWVIPLSLIGQYAISLLQARMHFTAFNFLRIVIPIGYFIGVFVLRYAYTVTAHSVVVLQLALNVITVFMAIVVVVQFGIVRRVAFRRNLARRLTTYGGKVWAGGLSQAANLRLDQALLSAFFPPVALGIYVTATSVAGLLWVLAYSVQMVVTPTVARRPPEQRNAELQRLFRRFWIINVLAALALAAAAPIIIPVMFGRAFSAAIIPTMILAIGGMFIGAKDVLAGGAQALGDPWLGSRSEIIAFVVTGVLLLALLPTFGIIGAAVASTMAYFTQFAIVVHGLAKRHGVPARSLLGMATPAQATGSAT